MVNGLDLFQKHFASYPDSYLLIGGCACDVHMSQMELPFRATKDVDMVLCVEALDEAFVRAFWEFVVMGRYSICQKSDGRRQFYRFQKPEDAAYPAMLELFSRKPDMLKPREGAHLTPIPVGQDVSSLSAILLDADYYRLLMETRRVYDGLSLAPPETLIVLKAKAWMDLTGALGEKVDQKDIRKHKNDIARLAVLVVPKPWPLPASVAEDMKAFLQEYASEKLDADALKLPLCQKEVLGVLKSLLLG